MKTFAKLILSLATLSSPSFSLAVTCKEVARVNKSLRFDCAVETELGTKTTHILSLKGSFAQNAYDQGYLMPEESADGVLKEAIERMNKDIASGGFAKKTFQQTLANCMRDRMYNSVSDEFLDGIGKFYWGLVHGMKAKKKEFQYSYNDVLMASLGIELSIAFEGIQRRMEDDPLLTFSEITTMCGITATVDNLNEFMSLFSGSLPEVGKMKMGCLGFVSPSQNNSDGSLLHARNFDANMVESWNKAPTIFVIEEPGFYKYAATSAAGMIFPAGISGFNEQGLSVTLHEMSTTHYRTQTARKEGVIAPFLQQRVLRETKSIEEAIALIQASKNFGAWTMLLSDSKNNTAASVEFSGDQTQVVRWVVNSPLGQSNHFLGSAMQDQAFTYNFNKRLESESRLSVISRDLTRDAGKIDIDWAIDHLSGHEDAFEGFRSFGRTATKAYTVMSTIAVPSRQEFWMTSGERRPASHSTFVGYKIDWAKRMATPFAQKRTQKFKNLPNWENSLSVYSEARLAFEKGNLLRADYLLAKAIDLAKRDQIEELPYHYMKARVLHQAGRYFQAAQEFEFLMQNRTKFHPYQQALIAMYSVATSDALKAVDARNAFVQNPSGRRVRLTIAENALKSLQAEYQHFDLKRKLQVLSSLKSSKSAKLPHLDFVTVE